MPEMSSSAAIMRDLFAQCRDMDASLNERLQSFSTAARKYNPAFGDAVERLIERLRQSGAGEAAPKVGDEMPPFVLPDEDGHIVSLDALIAKGPVAITFHRGHWCPYCRININALARAQRQIQREGGQIVAVMPDRQQFAAEFKSEAQAEFPILTDLDNGYALSLNLVFWVGAEMEKMIAATGRDMPAYHGNDAWMFPIPATFVVGTDGAITARFVDPDYRKRMEIEDLLGAIRESR